MGNVSQLEDKPMEEFFRQQEHVDDFRESVAARRHDHSSAAEVPYGRRSEVADIWLWPESPQQSRDGLQAVYTAAEQQPTGQAAHVVEACCEHGDFLKKRLFEVVFDAGRRPV